MPQEIAEFVENLEDLYVEYKAKLLTEDEYVSRKSLLIGSLLDKGPLDPKKFFAELVPSIERGFLTAKEVSHISNTLAKKRR